MEESHMCLYELEDLNAVSTCTQAVSSRPLTGNLLLRDMRLVSINSVAKKSYFKTLYDDFMPGFVLDAPNSIMRNISVYRLFSKPHSLVFLLQGL